MTFFDNTFQILSEMISLIPAYEECELPPGCNETSLMSGWKKLDARSKIYRSLVCLAQVLQKNVLFPTWNVFTPFKKSSFRFL